MIPNIAGVMSTSPVLIGSLVGLFQKVHGGSFEAQIQRAAAHQRGDQWLHLGGGVPQHLALKEGAADVKAIRERRAPHKPGDAALSTLARTLIEKRGRLDERDVSQFLQAGFPTRPGCWK